MSDQSRSKSEAEKVAIEALEQAQKLAEVVANKSQYSRQEINAQIARVRKDAFDAIAALRSAAGREAGDPAPTVEPVAWMTEEGSVYSDHEKKKLVSNRRMNIVERLTIPLYASPPAKWTDQEIERIAWKECPFDIWLNKDQRGRSTIRRGEHLGFMQALRYARDHGMKAGQLSGNSGELGAPADVQRMMSALTQEERMEVMSKYCAGCGTDKLPCHCQNDD